jgi:tetratricopeptide (TPR) repeat protein
MVLLSAVGVWTRWKQSIVAARLREAVEKRQFADVEAPLERWLRSEPNSAEAHYFKARVELARGRSQAALRELDRAQALGHPDREVHRWRAFVLVLSGRESEAEPILRRLASTASGPDPEVDEALARIFLQSYRLDAASRALDLWIRDAPNDPTPYVWYAEIDQRLNAAPAVRIDHLRKALARQPDLAKAQLGLADALRLAHRNDEAQTEYRRFLDRHPRDPAGHTGAGLNALARGRLEEAQADLDAALEVTPNDVTALRERAAIDFRQGRFAKALDRLERASKAQPNDGELLYRRSLVLTRLGRNEEAQQAQRAAGRLREDTARLNALREQLNMDPTNTKLRVEIARWLLGHGQEAEGLRWARTVLGRDPLDGPCNRLLAEHYQRQGDSGRANYYMLQAEASARAEAHKNQ